MKGKETHRTTFAASYSALVGYDVCSSDKMSVHPIRIVGTLLHVEWRSGPWIRVQRDLESRLVLL